MHPQGIGVVRAPFVLRDVVLEPLAHNGDGTIACRHERHPLPVAFVEPPLEPPPGLLAGDAGSRSNGEHGLSRARSWISVASMASHLPANTCLPYTGPARSRPLPGSRHFH